MGRARASIGGVGLGAHLAVFPAGAHGPLARNAAVRTWSCGVQERTDAKRNCGNRESNNTAEIESVGLLRVGGAVCATARWRGRPLGCVV
eukprot:5419795-Prymnesium_polylepis.1